MSVPSCVSYLAPCAPLLQAVIATQSNVDHSKITAANKNNALYAIILEVGCVLGWNAVAQVCKV